MIARILFDFLGLVAGMIILYQAMSITEIIPLIVYLTIGLLCIITALTEFYTIIKEYKECQKK